jgi:membrane dipeptidase
MNAHLHYRQRPGAAHPLPRAGLGILSAVLIAATLAACSGGMTEEQLQSEAARIHDEAWTADTHIDAPYSHAGSDWSASDRHSYGSDDAGQWDIPRMRDGGLDAAFMVVYVGQGPLTPEGYQSAYERAVQLFDWSHAVAEADPDAEIALTVADARRIHQAGKRALFMGVENGYPMGTEIARVGEFYDRGMRYVTLAHSSDNEIAASSGTSSEAREDFGLTAYGRQVVRELNRLGVMVDVSHVSDKSFYDVLEMTDVPVVLSHSACRALCSHSRNITDDMLRRLAENGGVIQLVALDSFVKDPEPNSDRDREIQALNEEFGDISGMSGDRFAEFRSRRSEILGKYPGSPAILEDFMKHIDHAVAVAGIDHVGFGSDFDGGGGIVGLEDVTKLPDVTIEMVRRGYSEQDIKKFWGGNLLRVMAAVEAAAGGSGN